MCGHPQAPPNSGLKGPFLTRQVTSTLYPTNAGEKACPLSEYEDENQRKTTAVGLHPELMAAFYHVYI